MADGPLILLHKGDYEETVLQLLGLSMGNPYRTEQVYAQYRLGDPFHLYGWVQAERLAGMMGIHVHSSVVHEIAHLSVMPDEQHVGIGRQMIQAYHRDYPHIQLFAETDKEAVGFYRRSGFVISSLGEKYPGVERFHCSRSVEY
ncbi:GNAT family N-acetyltransferase [Paenibacillus bovis]|uniref:N-acetyltransferase domain-containing protein n=1 Tax=Paenibacillus bovis TaxID=1616788 RepID=A0A172ZGN1_9BACL|nr:GNAT family N-acetyltransferase [Paenibacillus bovis]ANF96805.1 hypothetical protein AR543_12825 [Paenibacillus bovis]